MLKGFWLLVLFLTISFPYLKYVNRKITMNEWTGY